MLRFQLDKKQKELFISIWKKGAFWNKTLLISLAWALFLHLSFAFFFHVAPFKLDLVSTQAPPVLVEVSRPDTTLSIHEEESGKNPLEPLLSEPDFPPWPGIASKKEHHLNFELQDPFIKNFALLPVLAPKSQLISQVVIFADGQVPVLQTPVSKITSVESNAIFFEILIDNALGEIFWTRPFSKLDPTILHKAMQVVDSLKFTPIDTPGITRAIAEVTISD